MNSESTQRDYKAADQLKRRWNLDCEIVYGPIPSRRFGYSLGINLLPTGQKVCDFDCLYCQCGWTSRSLVEQSFTGVPFPSLVDIKRVVDLQFRRLASRDNQPDTIIFSGNGEPTLHPEFPRAVEEVERARDLYLPQARVGVLSNGSRLGESSVFNAVSGMDLKSVKFDAGGEWLDRPLAPYDLDVLITAWHNLPNLTVQSFFSEGRFDNTGSRDVEPWLEGLTRIQPNRVQIYTLDRIPPVKLMRKASRETLHRLAEKVKQQSASAVEVFE